MSQALYRKWRPARFEQVVGQEHVTHTLQQSVAADRVGHAYLFCGPRGTGKTTSARLLAKAVNCLDPDPAKRPCDQCTICKAINEARFLDLIEIDAASNTGVDDIRDLRDKINFAPNEGRFKVYIIDEVHMLSTAAFNALLKTLEEPPPHAKFVLATTEEHKVPATIKSRCQQFNFRLLTQAEIVARLQWLAAQEDLTIEPEALALIAQQAAGSIRDGESLLDQLVIAPGDAITLERTQQVLGTASNTAVIQLINAWLSSDGAGGLALIHEALASGTDARQFCRQMVAYLRQLLLLQAAGGELALDVTEDQKDVMLAQAGRAPRQGLIEAVKRFNEAAMSPASSWQPQLPLEMAFIELLPDEPLPERVVVKQTVAERPSPIKTTPPPPEPAPEPEPEAVVETATAVVPPPEPVEKKPAEAKNVSGGTAVSVAQITQFWRSMINEAGNVNRNLPALLNMAKPLAVESKNHIVLGFDYPIFKDKFDNTQGAAQTVGEIFSDMLHATCHVRCVVTSEYTVPISKEEFDALAEELGGIVRKE
ncbi:MAG: DNA polymerase III subunit gamma/tau [Ardenticatenaceae bacterium]|nr:DNA polymerase III subunit gamma/tau [Ardenticatenaceae bacterium]MCB8989731.1 DNA polymerase III subunit gamma/tau [Ardenticatenaceae bacterium]MCB9002810.1 DNA polymerase III subunit gamma/tau [Ardenticatenaceae bacterium]